ncbi:MAG: chromosomal replication initiator protein DnaA [Chloroflexota bacterium]|nr:chromosomal replication initiator protein DnaA [Chloroflexota bacterium]
MTSSPLTAVPSAVPPASSGVASPERARLWNAVLDELRLDPAISPANFSTWLRETQLLEGPVESPAGSISHSEAHREGRRAGSMSGGSNGSDEYVVGAPHSFARDRLARSFRPAVEQALARCLGQPSVRVRFAIADPSRDPSRGALPAPEYPPAPSRYTFARFVSGKGSEFAVAAARAVADNPALAYNPFYLHGSAGCGKTHLLQAIGSHISEQRPGVPSGYLTAAALAREITSSIRAAGGVADPRRYRGAGILLLDDVQSLGNMSLSAGSVAPPAPDAIAVRQMQEEVLQLLVALHDANVQVVVAGDEPPRAMTGLSERLRSWLQMGLVAGIGAPDFDTRLILVRQRADALRVPLPPPVLEVIARRAPGNIRELDGLVTRVAAAAELSRLPLTIEHVGALLAEVLGPAPVPSRRRATAEQVVLAVAATFGVAVAAMKGRRRDKEVVVPRQVAMYLMRHETGASLAEIGAELGGRDHSTVIHGCEKVAAALARDARLGEYVAAARQLLTPQGGR